MTNCKQVSYVVTFKETCFGAVAKDAVETAATADTHQNTDEAATGTRCLTAAAAKRKADDEATAEAKAEAECR